VNVIIPATNLKNHLSKVSSLGNIVIGNGQLASSGWDQTVVVTEPLLDLKEPISINNRLLVSTCSKLKGQVLLTYGGKVLKIRAGRFKAELPVTDGGIPIPASSLSELPVQTSSLRELLTFAGSVAEEDSKFDYTCIIQLKQRGKRLEAIGTDSLRIALAAAKAEEDVELDMLIPAHILSTIKSLENEVTYISETENNNIFRSGNTTIWARKYSKKFPDVSKVIPVSYNIEIEVRGEDLSESLQRISPITDQEHLKVVMEFRESSLSLSASSPLSGKAEDEIPITNLDPFGMVPKGRIACSINFLKKALVSFKGCETLSVKANGSGLPFLLEAGNKKILLAGIKV
jgi:DNA polymerase III sliding clamp (beta) subunit (PCNA family)